MADKNEIVPTAAQPTAVAFPQATHGMVNTGSGVQIGTNAGKIEFNINGISPEMLASFMSTFAMPPASQKVSHAVEWASLSQEHYCLFVLENEDYNCGAFSISKRCALQKYTPSACKTRYIDLTPAAVAELTNVPCVFAKRNMYYGYTVENHPALIGRITDIRCQGETVKICFSGFQAVSQQLLNRNIAMFKLAHASLRNELDEEHWSIKECNLLDAMTRLDVTVE